MEPETALWQQVLFRILCDALGFTNLPKKSKERTEAVEEARVWFYEGGEDVDLVCQYAGFDSTRVKEAGIALIEARQSGDHSHIPEFWRDAFRRNRMPSFTAYADVIDTMIGKM